MNAGQLEMIAIIAAIPVLVTGGACALLACLNPNFHKGFGRAPFSALMVSAMMLALGATWDGCGGWDAAFCIPLGALLFSILGVTLPARLEWNVAFVVLRIALPLAALVIGPQLPVWNDGCSL